MAPKIFLSYRWDDSGGWTRTIYDRLVAAYGDGEVFYDNTSMGPGSKIDDEIERALPAAQVVVPVMGRRWLETLEARAGSTSLDRVRWEVATALELGKQIVPVLVDDGRMPSEADLPDELRDLQSNIAITVSPAWLDRDIATLLETLVAAVPPEQDGGADVAASADAEAGPPSGGPASAPDDIGPSRLFVPSTTEPSTG